MKPLEKVRSCTLIYTTLLLCCSSLLAQKNNLSLSGIVSAGTNTEIGGAELAIDNKEATAWTSQEALETKWLQVVLPGATNIKLVVLRMEANEGGAVQKFSIQTYLNGTWRNFYKLEDNQKKKVEVAFDKAILSDRIRLAIRDSGKVRVKEFEIYGQEYIDSAATTVKKIIGNQSGYNLGKPKRFTAPEIVDGTSFSIRNTTTGEDVYQRTVKGHIGDFTEFNPLTNAEFVIAIDTLVSYPFQIAPYLLERISYRNMIDFMDGARHYTGSTKKIQSHSWAWRDGDFFNWSLQSLVAQYLSNPEAYKRMEKKISYMPNTSFPEEYKGKWGALEPYAENAPDIVKLIHWDTDVKISQGVEHEMQKAELAHFLYAYPYLKEWLPQQNFDRVYRYVRSKWEKKTVVKASTTIYDMSESHNLLALKTKMGTTKGEMPPGHSVIPNLMLYEVTKNLGQKDAQKYFEAAYRQLEWMIENLDWEDPMTTKGQRVSEHITMRAFAYFYHQYPDKSPKELHRKVVDWAKVAVRRSKNLWDFRRYTDNRDWVSAGWNETGNVLGFPACALAAKSVIKDTLLQKELDRIVWSHFDNAFGRNPTGRHFSHDGPTQIEGVDLGWYNEYKGGIGLLEPVRFVFDGSPKTNHYPNHPEIGNLGWTEGWVQHNVAFNISMAYLAHDETEITMEQSKKNTLTIRLKAPLNFDKKTSDTVGVTIHSLSGDSAVVTLSEENAFSTYLVGTIRLKKGKVNLKDTMLQTKKKDTLNVSYGLGYFKRETAIRIK